MGYGKEYIYEPEFAHPVSQDFWPQEVKKEDRQLLREEKRVDLAILEAWENDKNDGVGWDGREEIGLRRRSVDEMDLRLCVGEVGVGCRAVEGAGEVKKEED